MSEESPQREWLAASVSVLTAAALIGTVIAVPCWYAGNRYFTAKTGYFGYSLSTDGMSANYLISVGWQLLLPQVLWALLVATVCAVTAIYIIMWLVFLIGIVLRSDREHREAKIRGLFGLPEDFPVGLWTTIRGAGWYYWNTFVTDAALFKHVLLLSAVIPIIGMIASFLSGRDGGDAGRDEARLLHEMVMTGCARCYDFETEDGEIVTGFLVARSSTETMVYGVGGLHVLNAGEIKLVRPRQPDRAEAAPGEE